MSACGANGQPVCTETGCQAGTIDYNGVCTTCPAWTVAENNACVPCGGADQSACAGACQSGTVNVNGLCECGALGQPACGGTTCPIACDDDGCTGRPAVNQNAGVTVQGGVCTSCGEDKLPVCTVSGSPPCDAASLVPGLVNVRGTCGSESISASTNIAAQGDGGVTAQVTVTAASIGTLAMTPTITNTDQLTGFNYTLECSIGPYEVALVGYVGAAGFNLLGGSSTQDTPGTYGMVDPAMTADWATVQSLPFKCALTVSAYSTLGADLSAIGGGVLAALGYLADAYLQAFQLGDVQNGQLCMQCSSTVAGESGAQCPSGCPNPDIQPCGGTDDPRDSCETLSEYPVPGEFD